MRCRVVSDIASSTVRSGARRRLEAIVRHLVAAVLLITLVCPLRLHAQAESSSNGVIRIAAEEEDDVLIRTHTDSLQARAMGVVDSLRALGYLFARIDSAASESDRTNLDSGRQARHAAIVERGPLVRLGAVRITGIESSRSERLHDVMTVGAGRPLDFSSLESDVDRILREMERIGRPLARARIDALEPIAGAADQLAVTIHVEPGPPVSLRAIEPVGADRTNARLLAHLAGLRPGSLLTTFDADRIRLDIERSGLFASVGEPELLIGPDTTAVIRVPVEEEDPGAFDLVLGYLPRSSEGGTGRIVGNGHLALSNFFGGGRTVSLRLHRLPGQVSRLDASVSDPYIAGLPVGVHAAFQGLEQDSTYGKRSYAGSLRYHVRRGRLTGGMVIEGGVRRDVTSPGHAGLRLGPQGRQVIPASEAWFLGIGTTISTVDRRQNPTRGLFVEMSLESGRKQRSERLIADADTTRRTSRLEQQRLVATGRFFLPTFVGQVIAIGGDGSVLLSDEFDRSDLFRFGGATSLRGYDEERFLGSVVGRILAEYRFLIDLRSFAYAFFDLGYVDRPETPDLQSSRSIHPGYGVGIQFNTTVGLVNVSAALNPDSGPTETRIHAGLSFGL